MNEAFSLIPVPVIDIPRHLSHLYRSTQPFLLMTGRTRFYSPFLLFLLLIGCGVKPSGTTQTSPPDTARATELVDVPEADPPTTLAGDTLRICSFNIKFIGFYKKKDHRALADVLKDYDIVLIQELVSPPAAGSYPDGASYTADAEAKEFMEAMTANGYEYLLSSEDTGTNDEIHSNSSATEWFIVFYKPERVDPATDLITGFLAEDRGDHPSYERVPHAFSFRTKDRGLDFTLISVHLQPGSGSADKARRAEELAAIAAWIDAKDETEEDYLIAGDMNIYSREELQSVLPAGYRSLNDACLPTNIAGGKPYDHVMYHETNTGPDLVQAFTIVDLVEAMRPYWQGPGAYPENDQNLYYQYYSDHRPVVFRMVSDGVDED